MSDLVGNPETRFSRVAAHNILFVIKVGRVQHEINQSLSTCTLQLQTDNIGMIATQTDCASPYDIHD